MALYRVSDCCDAPYHLEPTGDKMYPDIPRCLSCYGYCDLIEREEDEKAIRRVITFIPKKMIWKCSDNFSKELKAIFRG